MPIKNWGTNPARPDAALSLSELQTEFGGANPISLNEYYSGGSNGFVPPGTTGTPGTVLTTIPASGTISMANFYGSTRQITFKAYTAGNTNTFIDVPAGTWFVAVRLTGAGGGPGGADGGMIGSNGGPGTSMIARFRVVSAQAQRILLYGSSGGRGGFSQTRSAGGGSGGLGYISGGQGGDAGNSGTSGAGGGGGGASAVVWQPTAGAAPFIVLAATGGGGGGTGSGLYSITNSPGTVSNANNTPRGLTSVLTNITSITTGPTFWWDPVTQGYAAYRRVPTMKGQGVTNMTDYYPPGTEAWSGNHDGGAGGGGGGGNGYSGGLTNAANGSYRWNLAAVDKFGTLLWQTPYEFCGVGGSQGHLFINSLYFQTGFFDNTNAQGHTGYGGGSQAINGGGNETVVGGPGAASVIVSNTQAGATFPDQNILLT